MWASITAIVSVLLPFLKELWEQYFKKDPAKIKQETMAKDLKKRQANAHEISDALKKAESGDTSSVNDILNGR